MSWDSTFQHPWPMEFHSNGLGRVQMDHVSSRYSYSRNEVRFSDKQCLDWTMYCTNLHIVCVYIIYWYRMCVIYKYQNILYIYISWGGDHIYIYILQKCICISASEYLWLYLSYSTTLSICPLCFRHIRRLAFKARVLGDASFQVSWQQENCGQKAGQ